MWIVSTCYFLIRLYNRKMLKHSNISNLLKRGFILCVVIFLFFMILPSTYISKGVGDSFGVAVVRDIAISIDNTRISSSLTLLHDVCKSVNKSAIAHPKTLLYSKSLNLVYCPIPLATDTEFKQSLLKIEGKRLTLKTLYQLSDYQAIHSEAQSLNLKQSVRSRPQSLSHGSQQTLIIARDPWERLILAYRMSVGTGKYKIQCSTFVNTTAGKLEFDGFLQCLLLNARGPHGLNKLDTTLSPMNAICAICQVPYTSVAKYETVADDLLSIFSNKKTETYTRFKDILQQTYTSEPKADEVDINFYIQLARRSSINAIQSLYELDFKLFNYQIL